MQSNVSSSELLYILVVCVSFRILIASLIKSSFHPDEYYQTLEPSLYIVHNQQSFIELTWEWDYSIRSFNGIIHYILYFKFCKYLKIDGFHVVMVTGPRIIHAILSGLADYLYYKISLRISNKKSIATSCLFVHLLSWSSIYFYSRTLINVLESNLFIYFMYMSTYCKTVNGTRIVRKLSNNVIFMYPFTFTNMNYSMIVLMTYTVHIRPTAVLLFVPLTVMIAVGNISKKQNFSHLWLVVLEYSSIVIIATAVFTVIDCLFYGRKVYPPYSFYDINVARGFASTFFGQKPFYWYVTSAVPTILGIYYPVLLYGILFAKLETKHYEFYLLLSLAFFVVVMLSIVTKHKEIRFLLPILPLFHMYIGAIIEKVFFHGAKSLRRVFMFYLGIGVVLQLIASMYLLFYHQVGTEKSFEYLSGFVKRTYSSVSNVSVHILAPCHAFPGYSHLTVPGINVLLQEPDCYPSLNHFTESQLFEQSSFEFWQQKLETNNYFHENEIISDKLFYQRGNRYALSSKNQSEGNNKLSMIENPKSKRYAHPCVK